MTHNHNTSASTLKDKRRMAQVSGGIFCIVSIMTIGAVSYEAGMIIYESDKMIQNNYYSGHTVSSK